MLIDIIKLLPDKYKINKDNTIIFIEKDVKFPIIVYLDDKIFISLNVLILKEINTIITILNKNNIQFYLISSSFRRILNKNTLEDIVYELLHIYYNNLTYKIYYVKISEQNRYLIDKSLLNTIRLCENGMKEFSKIHNEYHKKCDDKYFDYYIGKHVYSIENRECVEYIKSNKRRVLLTNLI